MKFNVNTISIISILSLTIVVFLIFQKYQAINKQETQAIEAIPTNAAIIIESDNWVVTYNDLENATIFKTITQSATWNNIKSSINQLKSTLNKDEQLGTLIDEKQMFLSLHHSTDGFNFQVSTTCSDAQLDLILSHDSIIENYNTRPYDGITIYQLPNNILLCHHNDLLFFSNSNLLIEEGIRQLNNKVSLLDNPAFSSVQSTKSTFSVAHVYINFKALSKFVAQNTTLNFKDTQWLSRWANWAELDLEIANDDLTFSGFTVVEDSSSNYLTSLFGQNEQRMEISKIAPKNTNKIVAFGIDDSYLFYTNYKEFLAKHNNLYDHNKHIKSINSDYSINIEETINGIILNEMGAITTVSTSNQSADYLFFKVKEESIEVLNFLSQSIANDSIFSEDYRGFVLSRIDIPFLFYKMYGYFFKAVKNNYYTWIDQYLIVADTPANLKAFINYYLSEKVLSNHPNYLTFSDKIATKSNFLLYTNPSIGNWGTRIKSTLDSLVVIPDWENINGFVYQLSSKDKLFYNNIVLNYESNNQQDSQLEWIVDLEKPIINEPHSVFNHQSKKNNILIQDSDKRIYLINENGKILWNRPIGGKVLDKIHQLDFYKNRKLQFVFNTEDSLYVIDRLGRNVENFPHALNDKASRGLTIVDYDKNRTYRLLVPCIDGYVYNYNKEGELVNGWKFEALENGVAYEVKYASVGSKDYIYVVDKKGHISIVGRNGKKRVELNTIPITDDFYLDKTNGDIYSSDTLGNVWLTKLNGTSTKIKTSNLNDHRFYAYPFHSNSMMELFISDLETVQCYNLENKTMTFKVPSLRMPKAFTFNNESFLAVSSDEYCYLFKSDGSLATSKPLFGGGTFTCLDLDKDNKLNLVVVNTNALYNYVID